MKKQIKKLIIKNLNSIYNSCKKTARDWGKYSILLIYLEEVIKLIKPKNLPKELIQFGQSYSNILDTLLKTCQATAKKMDSKEIHLDLLKKYIKVLKEEFLKALD